MLPVLKTLRALGLDLPGPAELTPDGAARPGARNAALAVFWDRVQVQAEGPPPAAGGAAPPVSADSSLEADGADVLHERFGASWGGVGHPLLAGALPLWLGAVQRLGREPRVVLVIRDPAEVAAQMNLEQGVPAERALMLWLDVVLPLRELTAQLRRVVVEHARFLANPQAETHRIAEHLGLPHEPAQALAVADVAETLPSAAMAQAMAGEPSLGLVGGAGALAERVFRALSSVAADEVTWEHPSLDAPWAECVREYHRLLRDSIPLDAEGASDAGLRRRVADLERELDDTKHTLAAQSALAARWQAMLTRRDETLRAREAGLNRQVEENRALRAQLEQMTALANRERLTVLKPIARRLIRRARSLVLALPHPVVRRLRALKRRLYPRPIAAALRAPEGASAGMGGRAGPIPVLGTPARLPGAVPLEDVRAAAGDAPDVIVFSAVDWYFRTGRAQQLVRQLARHGHRVFYLAPRFLVAQSGPGFELTEAAEPGIFLCQMHLPAPAPRLYQDRIDEPQCAFLAAALDNLRDACGTGPVVALVHHPGWSPVAVTVPGAPLIYDLSARPAGWPSEHVEGHRALVSTADLLIAASSVTELPADEEREAVILPNGADVDRFRAPPERLAIRADSPVAGFLGDIGPDFDPEWVAAAARALPAWRFVLAGTARRELSALESLPNVELRSEPLEIDWPTWMHAFDVFIHPCAVAEAVPESVHAALAAGRPVVAKAAAALEPLSAHIRLCTSAQGFREALGAAESEAADAGLAARRTEWASAHDWSVSGDRLAQAIGSLYPKVSVIVLTYNNLDLTRKCLDSLVRFTRYPNWELLLVDNGSTDGTPAFLESFADAHPAASAILNGNNLGFAGGMNVGLAAATGDYLVLLNNDTYVTEGWLADLIRPLRRDPGLGLVGPVTNRIANEAQIPIRYTSMDAMAAAARTYTRAHVRELLPTRRLGFFCIALRRDVFETVGGLDEAFDVGWFEDDDYCNRVRVAGYRLAIAEDVFVHHQMSATFGLMEDGARKALFERNRAVYEQKWGPWTPPRHR